MSLCVYSTIVLYPWTLVGDEQLCFFQTNPFDVVVGVAKCFVKWS